MANGSVNFNGIYHIPLYIPVYKDIIFISLYITTVDPISPIAHRFLCNDHSHEVEITDHDYLIESIPIVVKEHYLVGCFNHLEQY